MHFNIALHLSHAQVSKVFLADLKSVDAPLSYFQAPRTILVHRGLTATDLTGVGARVERGADQRSHRGPPSNFCAKPSARFCCPSRRASLPDAAPVRVIERIRSPHT